MVVALLLLLTLRFFGPGLYVLVLVGSPGYYAIKLLHRDTEQGVVHPVIRQSVERQLGTVRSQVYKYILYVHKSYKTFNSHYACAKCDKVDAPKVCRSALPSTRRCCILCSARRAAQI